MKQQINPVMAIAAIVALVAIAGFFIWRGIAGEPRGNPATDLSIREGIQHTTKEIPSITGARPGMTAPDQQSGGGVSTPLMPSNGMTAPNTSH